MKHPYFKARARVLRTAAMRDAADINSKMLEQSKFYLMLINEEYLLGLRDPRDSQHQDFLRQLEIARRMKKKTLIVYDEESVSPQELKQLREEFMQGIDVHDCIPVDFRDQDDAVKGVRNALKQMLKDE